MADPVFELKDVSVRYGGELAVSDVTSCPAVYRDLAIIKVAATQICRPELVHLVDVGQRSGIRQLVVRLERITAVAIEIDGDCDQPRPGEHAAEVLLDAGQAIERGHHEHHGERVPGLGHRVIGRDGPIDAGKIAKTSSP